MCRLKYRKEKSLYKGREMNSTRIHLHIHTVKYSRYLYRVYPGDMLAMNMLDKELHGQICQCKYTIIYQRQVRPCDSQACFVETEDNMIGCVSVLYISLPRYCVHWHDLWYQGPSRVLSEENALPLPGDTPGGASVSMSAIGGTCPKGVAGGGRSQNWLP
jgi:hypothetical protein